MKSRGVSPTLDWTKYLSEIEQSIVSGQHEMSRDLLKKYSPLFGPREYATQLAELSLRANMPLYALKKLHKYAMPENTLLQPTDLEKTIYASALYHLGSVQDAQDILKHIDLEKNPEARFHLARSYMHIWDYSSAVTHLGAYLRQGQFDDYRRLCTRVNLAAALISVSRLDEAEAELKDVLTICEASQHTLLEGNCYELLGQIFFFKNLHEQSLEFLKSAEAKLKNQAGWYLLFVHKWILLNEMALGRSHQELSPKIDKLRSEAIELEQWNTLRDLDFFWAVFTSDDQLKAKVVFGSNKHFVNSRNRFHDITDATKLKQFLWVPHQVDMAQIEIAENQDFIFDIEEYNCNALIVKTFYALVSDLYEPTKLGEIFAQVYKGEVFNPLTSPGRVLKLLKRLDGWFIQNGIPLRVFFKKSAFEIRGAKNCKVLIRKIKNENTVLPEFRTLQEVLKGKHLNIKTICSGMESSESTVLRLINKALEQGFVAKDGTGKNTRYYLAKKKDRVSA